MQTRLIEAFQETARRFPDKTALITPQSQMSFRDIMSLVQTLDIELKTRGVQDGQTIVLDTDRGEMSVAFSLLLSLRSLEVVFTTAELAASRGIPFDRVVTTAHSELLPPEKQIVMEADWFSIMGTLPEMQFGPLTGEGGAFITQTSGSTGVPKFVRSPELSRLHDMRAMCVIPDADLPGVRFMTTAAGNTGWALNNNLPILLGGGSVVSLGKDTAQALVYADLWHVSHMSVTPFILQEAVRLGAARQYLTSLRSIEIGGAYAPPQLLDAVSEFCEAELITSFGATEVGSICRRVHSRNDRPPQGYLGEVYRDDVELVFVDEAHTVLPGADEGILAVRPASEAPRGYAFSELEPEQAGFVGDLFVTGDIMRREGSSLFLVGRQKRVLNLNGNKYSLDQIQSVLSERLGDRAQVAAIATRGTDDLEQLTVFHTADTELSPPEVEALLREYWKKLTVGGVCRLESIPATATGKIDLQALRNLVASAQTH